MKIKGKQIEDILRSSDNPFTNVYADDFVGDLNGAIRFEAKNTSGGVINKGEAVYVTGVSGDTKPTVSKAQANSASTMPAFGITAATLSNNQSGEIVTFGNITGVDTDSFNLTDTLYISADTAGALTNSAPSGSTNLIQNIGKVIRKHADSGTIKVGGAGRTNATPNLDEGHFFLGNASNQSVESAYQLPIAVGTSGQVLTSNGTNITFEDLETGDMSVSVQSSDFSASVNNLYIVDTSGGEVICTIPYDPLTVGDRIKIFNYGTGILRIRETDSPTTLDPNDGTEGTSGSSKYINSKCLVELIATSTTNWSYVISPQLELDASSLSRNGEIFAYDLSEKAMKPLNYTLPSAVAADDTKILTYDHANTQMLFSAIPEIKSPYLEVTTSTPSFDASTTNYVVPRVTSLSSITMDLPLANASGSSDLDGVVFEIVNNSPVAFTLSVADRRDASFTYYTDVYLNNVSEAPSDGAYTVDLTKESVYRISIQYRASGNDFFLDYNVLTLT